jgi:hypothetical protein
MPKSKVIPEDTYVAFYTSEKATVARRFRSAL